MKPKRATREKMGSSGSTWFASDVSELVDDLEDLGNLQKRTLKSRWLDQVIWMEKRAEHTQNWHYALRLTAVIGGILIPISITISKTGSLEWLSWVATGLGALVAVASAVEDFFDYGERWRNYRSTVELLKIEGWHFFQLSGPYSRRETHADAYEKFAGRVEEIIQHDVQIYINEIVGEPETEEKKQKLKETT
jgi:hypothetical protein